MLGNSSIRAFVPAAAVTGGVAYHSHWVVGSCILLLWALAWLIGWDIRRANGVAAWVKELVGAATWWEDFRCQRRQRRDAQRTEHLLERHKRRQIRKGYRERNEGSA
jgi:hypothetical protein